METTNQRGVGSHWMISDGIVNVKACGGRRHSRSARIPQILVNHFLYIIYLYLKSWLSQVVYILKLLIFQKLSKYFN